MGYEKYLTGKMKEDYLKAMEDPDAANDEMIKQLEAMLTTADPATRKGLEQAIARFTKLPKLGTNPKRTG